MPTSVSSTAAGRPVFSVTQWTTMITATAPSANSRIVSGFIRSLSLLLSGQFVAGCGQRDTVPLDHRSGRLDDLDDHRVGTDPHDEAGELGGVLVRGQLSLDEEGIEFGRGRRPVLRHEG